MSNSYSGYVTSAARDSKIAWAIPQGSRAYMESKFHVENHLQPIADAATLNASVYLGDVANVKKGDFHPYKPGQETIMMPMEKQFVALNSYAYEFPDYLGDIAALKSLNVATVEEKFYEVDKVNEGYILPRELPMVVRAGFAQGKEPSTHLIGTLEGFFIRAKKDRITIDHLLSVLADAIEYLEKDLNAERPENMKAFREQTRKKLANPYVEAEKLNETKKAIVEATRGISELTATMGAASNNDKNSSSSSVRFDDTTSTSSRRLLTAQPLSETAAAAGTASRPAGLMVGAMREAQLNGEANRRGLPPAIPKPGATTAANLRLSGPEPESSYDRDEGRYGMNPNHRPVSDADIRGFHMTTRELAAGTTRVSKQLPGYMGHVPAYTGGDSAQGIGMKNRDSFLDHTNLTVTYSRRTPSYTGFLPQFAAGNVGTVINKTHGALGGSDYDRAAGAVESYWAARHGTGSPSLKV